jgi:hypothetical protein
VAIESAAMADYRINSAYLARRLLGRELVPDGDRPFVEQVRAMLQRFGCPPASGSRRPQYLVAHGGQVLALRHRPDLEPVDGIGAILRY